MPTRADLGVIAYAAEQAVGDARRASGAAGDLFGAVGIHGHAQQARGTRDDARQFLDIVGIQAQNQSEAAAQRGADESLASGRADAGEPLDVHRDGARAGSGADEDVHAEILEGGIDHFLDVRQQAVDFVDEEDFAFLDVAEDADEVEFLLQRRGRRWPQCAPLSDQLTEEEHQRRVKCLIAGPLQHLNLLKNVTVKSGLVG